MGSSIVRHGEKGSIFEEEPMKPQKNYDKEFGQKKLSSCPQYTVSNNLIEIANTDISYFNLKKTHCVFIVFSMFTLCSRARPLRSLCH